MMLTLDQRFQDVTGTLAGDGRTLPLRDVALRGARLSFTVDLPAGPRTFVGVADGVTIAGEGGWSARRAD